MPSHTRIRLDERRYHDIGTVETHATVFGVERLAGKLAAAWVSGTGIPRLHPLAEALERLAELLKGGRMVAVLGIADTLESRAHGDGGDGELSGACGGIALIHILYALCLRLRAAGIEVDLQVACRLERHLELQVFGEVGGSRSGHALAHEEPAVLTCLLHIVVAIEAEGEVESGTQQVALALSEDIAHHRHESRYRHLPLVAVGEVDGAHHHQAPGDDLCRLIPCLVVERCLGCDRNLHRQCRVGLVVHLDLVVVDHFEFHGDGLAILVLCRDDEPAALLVVRHRERGIGLDDYLLLEGVLVLGQRSLFLAVVSIATVALALGVFHVATLWYAIAPGALRLV